MSNRKYVGNGPVGGKDPAIGFEGDFLSAPFDPGNIDNTVMAYLKTMYYHAHGLSFVKPDHANSIQLVAAANSWDTSGSIIEVIPANTIQRTFDLHWIIVSAISENSEIQIDVYSGDIGSEILIAPIAAVRNAVQSQEGAIRIQIPRQPKNTRVSCKLSSSTSNATTAKVKFMGHVYGNVL